ncbi:hypothetical protein [Fimbriimonas ginsengisoli]|uniref:Uncharacterized protein n=1 Tax=Fimbriimonas ginsengisoli Gsoil 348 TaxID=661478 RepID=A0A068NR12_FIMGI|nr:hypothetical protein [Fimbriimonas ginsengisoli]AIE85822.1 hypothetical protein OP10G_2454 [Fimbriimonas ginsengisoli Gsoil 348]
MEQHIIIENTPRHRKRLSPIRQKALQILRSEGMTQPEVAEALSVSDRCVRTYERLFKIVKGGA